MEGTNIVIMPFFVSENGKASFSREELSGLYNRVISEGMEELLFYDGTINSCGEFLNSVHSEKTLLFIPFVYDDNNYDPLGMIWLNRFERFTAQGHYVFYRNYWGTGLAEKAGRMFMQQVTESMFTTLVGVTPLNNPHACQYCKDIGMTEVGIIPKMVYSKAEDKAVDAILHYITKDDFKEGD